MNLDWFGRGKAVTSASAALHLSQQPLFIQVTTRIMFLMMVLSVFALLFVPWQQTSNASGRLIAYDAREREQAIEAPTKGVVSRWHVREGDEVKKGDVIVELSDNDPNYTTRLTEQRDAIVAQRESALTSIAEVERQIESLGRVKELTLASMDAKIAMARREVEAARLERTASEGVARATAQNLTRKETLAEQGLTSQRELELAQMKATKEDAYVAKASAKLQEKRSKVLGTRAEREAKSSDIDAKIAETRAKLESWRAKLAKANESLAKAEVNLARQQLTVIAPRDGVIWRINAFEGGDQVKAGDELAQLVPSTEDRSVELWIDGNDAPLVYEGREVQMQFEGYPAIMFSGFPDLAAGTFTGRVAFMDARADTSGRFRVIVKPDPKAAKWPDSNFLRQGARVNAWIQLGQVSLGYEVWRQLNGFPPTLPNDRLEELGGKKNGKGKGKKK